jgi:AcrR family transcriptional regulator
VTCRHGRDARTASSSARRSQSSRSRARRATRAGVGKATIYRHWGSRAALVHAALFANTHDWSEPDTGSVRADLVALLHQLVAYLADQGTGRVFTSFLDAAAREPDLRALLDQTEREGRVPFARAIRRGITRGELARDIDIDLTIDLLVAPFVYRSVVLQSRIDARDVEPLVDTVLRGAPRSPTALSEPVPAPR